MHLVVSCVPSSSFNLQRFCTRNTTEHSSQNLVRLSKPILFPKITGTTGNNKNIRLSKPKKKEPEILYMCLIIQFFCGCNKSVNFFEFWQLEICLLPPSYRYSLDSCYVGWHWVSGWTGCQSITWLTHGDKQRFPLAFTPSGCGGTKRKCTQEHGNWTEKHFFCESFLFSLADLKEQMQGTKGFFLYAQQWNKKCKWKDIKTV